MAKGGKGSNQYKKKSAIGLRMRNIGSTLKADVDPLAFIKLDNDTPPRIMIEVVKRRPYKLLDAMELDQCPIELMYAAMQGTPMTRLAVVSRSDCPKDILVRLSKDLDILVRIKVAENVRTPVDTLMSMLDDNHPGVRQKALYNPNLPENVRTMHILGE